MEVEWNDPTLLQIYEGDTTYSNQSGVFQLPTANVWTYVVIETTDAITHPIHLHGNFLQSLPSPCVLVLSLIPARS